LSGQIKCGLFAYVSVVQILGQHGRKKSDYRGIRILMWSIQTELVTHDEIDPKTGRRAKFGDRGIPLNAMTMKGL
jgi:hypothetical protein